MNSVELRFVDELFEDLDGEEAYSVHATCSGPVATIGMPLNGAVFSAIPPILLGPPDRSITAPLLIDANGCSNGLFVDNPGGNAGMARDCGAVVDFANALIAGGSTAADLPVRQWGKGDQERIDDWAGIGIEEGRVSAINLPGLGLRGAISAGSGAARRPDAHRSEQQRTDRQNPAGTGATPVAHIDLTAWKQADRRHPAGAFPIDRTVAAFARLESADRTDPAGIDRPAQTAAPEPQGKLPQWRNPAGSLAGFRVAGTRSFGQPAERRDSPGTRAAPQDTRSGPVEK